MKLFKKKEGFLDDKNVLCTKSKYCIYPKGLTWDFGQFQISFEATAFL